MLNTTDALPQMLQCGGLQHIFLPLSHSLRQAAGHERRVLQLCTTYSGRPHGEFITATVQSHEWCWLVVSIEFLEPHHAVGVIGTPEIADDVSHMLRNAESVDPRCRCGLPKECPALTIRSAIAKCFSRLNIASELAPLPGAPRAERWRLFDKPQNHA